MKFLFNYASFGRPGWFKQTLDKYYSMLSGQHEYEFRVTLNQNDVSMNNKEMRTFMDGHSHLKYNYGNHQNKIEAINADMEDADFDVLFVVSDDMTPIVPSFDNVIAALMEEKFPDMDGALHFHDGCCGKDVTITLSIMGKKMYDYFGYVYHPDYKSFYCDLEFTDEVRRLGKVHYSSEIIVKHDYKGWGRADDTYRRNSKLGIPDAATYERRKKAGFPK